MNKKINRFKLTMLYLIGFLFLPTSVIVTTYTQTQNRVNPINDPVENIPIVNFEDSEDRSEHKGIASAQENEYRIKKNERYDSYNIVHELPVGVIVKPKSSHWVNNVPALPIEQSSEIIIGVVKTSDAFLSNDKTGVYSEFLISIEGFLKSTFVSKEDREVFVERAGGGVRFPSGRIQRIEVFRGQQMPQIAGRYVFFLKKLEGGKDFSILTGYEIKGGKVIPLDPLDPFIMYKNMDEAIFIEAITNEIKEINAIRG